MPYADNTHPFIGKLIESPVVDRVKKVLSDVDSASQAAAQAGPSFLRLFPHADRETVSTALGNPFGDVGPHHGTPVPSSVQTYGPGPLLLNIPQDRRAGYILTHEAEFEDFIKEIPEYLLLLPESDRKAVSEEFGGVGQQYLPAVQMSRTAAVTTLLGGHEGRAGKPWVETVGNQQVSWPQASTKHKIGDNPAHMSLADASALLSRAGSASYLVQVAVAEQDEDGSMYRMNHEYASKDRDAKNESHELLSPDGKTLSLWDLETKSYEDIPVSSVRYMRLVFGKDAEDYIEVILPGIQVDNKVPKGIKAPAKKETKDRVEKTPHVTKTLSEKGEGLTAEKIIEDLTPPTDKKAAMMHPQAEIKYYAEDEEGRLREYTVFASHFPEGMSDTAGEPRSFNTPDTEGYVAVWDIRLQHIVDIPIDGITFYEKYNAGFELSTMESDPMGHKKEEGVQHIMEYLKEYDEFLRHWSSIPLALIDTETVGLLPKAYATKNKNVGSGANMPINLEQKYKVSEAQLLQIAGLKIQATDGKFYDSHPFNDDGRIKLSSHNLNVLLREVKQGFGKDSPEELQDSLHFALSLIHRPGFQMKEADVLGDDSGSKLEFAYKKKHGAKRIAAPEQLDMAAYREVLAREAASLIEERESLAMFLNWVDEDPAAKAFVGHNAYSFDRQYLLARIDVYPDLKAGRSIIGRPYLDTLHLAQIMFLPAISTLAFSKNVKVPDQEGVREIPESIRSEAFALASAIKNAKLGPLALALGHEADISGAHDAFYDVKMTLFLLNALLGKLASWDSYLKDSSLYKHMRRNALAVQARNLSNKKRK